jgi:hypothetical protein
MVVSLALTSFNSVSISLSLLYWIDVQRRIKELASSLLALSPCTLIRKERLHQPYDDVGGFITASSSACCLLQQLSYHLPFLRPTTVQHQHTPIAVATSTILLPSLF